MATIDEITSEIRTFADERDWAQFHSVRNLLLALVGEVGELASELQWVADENIGTHLSELENISRFEMELADVATYLFRLSDIAGVDLAAAMRKKLTVNAQRYPVEKSRGSSAKYTELN
jgi:NTP pyrophosphatase (non-canonical NTP hydrolase)